MDISRKPALRLGAVAVVVIFAGICVFATFEILPMRFLFSGRLPFAETGIAGAGWYTRALAYLIQFLMSGAVLVLAPTRHLPLVTLFGARSLQIYFWHFIPTALLRAAGLFPWLSTVFPGVTWQIMVVIIGILVAFILGWKPFGVPLDWITRTVRTHNISDKN